MCLNQSGFFYLRCQRQGHLHRPLLLRISSVVFLNIYMPHREVHWESANEVAQEYVEGPELLGGEEEGEEQEETGVQGLAL